MPDAATSDLRERLGDLTLRDEHRLGRRLDRVRRTDDPERRGRDLQRLAGEIDRAGAHVAARRQAVPEVSYPEELPVSTRRADLLAAIGEHQVVIVAGETGSGKTTQIPKMCLELGRGVRGTIAHTQPRRIAARTVAERIADELGVPLGGAVGYSVRFNDRSGEDTLVRLLTDGLLLAEVRRDPLLRRYDTIIVDEAHERSLNIDFLLGILVGILPRRPDLKLVITSATIDPERFSRHFADAPIVEVSGRTFPVEVRYRPVQDPDDPDSDPDRDQPEAIVDAVSELFAEDPAGGGDVLVFLSGEREIRDASEALRRSFATGTRGPRGGAEVLPLYSRLSTAEQRRVFRRATGAQATARRVVLATNVAETSLTVPGIRYVVDTGTARISRYSSRLKVQRLPIEPISKASADQRKGRCGRTSDGICVRLYSEEGFDERPAFTDPEILRTSLAAVILQMAALDLGEVEAFAFLDPPDRRQVRDGLALLHELHALEDAGGRPDDDGGGAGGERGRGYRLTPLGRRLARLPVDPRMGRMVLEADRLGCVDEVIVLAAVLSIQDPRERPSDQQAQADQAHARFHDEDSDFVGLLNLWRYLREQQRELSANQFRKRCRAEYLHHLRIREWQDLVGQLRQAAKQAGVTFNPEPVGDDLAGRARIHQALLSGLLSHVGLKEAPAAATGGGARRGGRSARPEYLGARGARFQLFPGSALARKPPAWVVVAELVETSRLWGRAAARIEPGWVEPLAEHLVKRTYAEPHWERRRASVVAAERVTLYGLALVTGRKVAYGAIDPALSRELFIRQALVEGDWDARHAFLDANRALVAKVEALEERARRRDILVDDETRFRFYDERVPAEVVSGRHFDRWWRDERRRRPDLLTFTRQLLVREQAADAADERGRPQTWRQGDLTLPLSYRFEPGADRDGVTVHVPLTVLPRLRPDGFEWLVPAFRVELVTALIRSLPKELRRALVPVPETAERVLERLTPRREPLTVALARELGAVRRVRVPPGALRPDALPAHLRMTFRIEDADGALVAAGEDLERLRAEARPRLRSALAAATPGLERRGMTSWDVGTLPRTVALPGSDDAVRAFPALVDEGAEAGTVGVRVLDTADAQRAAMYSGTLRLLLITVPFPVRYVRERLDAGEKLTLSLAPHGSLDAVIEDARAAAVETLMVHGGGPGWDAPSFEGLRAHVAGRLPDGTVRVLGQVARVLDAHRDVVRRLEELAAAPAAFGPALRDVEAQLGRLVGPGLVTGAGARRLPDLVRYLRAALRRLERLPDAVAVDRDRMRAVHELEQSYRRRVETWPADRPQPDALRDVRWAIEELRVSHFAQALGVKGQVSSKRIRRTIDEAR